MNSEMNRPHAGTAGALAILTYHSLDGSGSIISVSPSDFADQMRCLADLGFRGISLREAVEHRTLTGSWPSQAVALTFDDGYANVYEHGMPVLERYGFNATVFLVSDYVGGHNTWETLPSLGRHCLLTWKQANEMVSAGVEMGSHTRTHPDLSKMSGPDVEIELVASRDEIAQRTGQKVQSFAYPFGAINRATIALAAREFCAACTTNLSRAKDEPLSSLPRVDMYYINKVHALERLVNGQFDNYLAVRQWGRKARHLLMG